MLVLLISFTVVLTIISAVFLLGLRVGGRHWHSELQRTRFEASRAERRLHDLTRELFVTMAEHAERRSGDR